MSSFFDILGNVKVIWIKIDVYATLSLPSSQRVECICVIKESWIKVIFSMSINLCIILGIFIDGPEDQIIELVLEPVNALDVYNKKFLV